MSRFHLLKLLFLCGLCLNELRAEDPQIDPDTPEVQSQFHALFLEVRTACAEEFLLPYGKLKRSTHMGTHIFIQYSVTAQQNMIFLLIIVYLRREAEVTYINVHIFSALKVYNRLFFFFLSFITDYSRSKQCIVI